MVALPLDPPATGPLSTLSEKHQPLPIPTRKPTSSSSKRAITLTLLGLYFLGLLSVDIYGRWAASAGRSQVWTDLRMEGKCPAQPEAIEKGKKWEVPANYSMEIAEKLSRAIQIPTVSYDDMGAVGEDPRWNPHTDFAAFLSEEFPLVYSTLKHEMVNTHAHFFTWEGTNPDLQPILFMAHEDVVPVNAATVNQWSHGPFEGHIDGTWIWGRGAADCKNQLMGVMNAVEKLVGEGFKPERTILINFGFDEEIGGAHGAQPLSRVVADRYGPSSLAFLIDEGFGGIDDAYGATFASFGMAEKGFTNILVTVDTPGGHSSVPPPHTGIGLMSEVLTTLEANPPPIEITPANPYVKYLTCLAEYAPDLDESTRSMIMNPKKWKKLAKLLTKDDPIQRAFLGTTQAIDLISGGVKVNALPELVSATINYRISFTSSIAETKAHVAAAVAPLAKKLGIKLEAFGKEMSEGKDDGRKITVTNLGFAGVEGTEPAPITSEKTEAFELMAGTVKNIWAGAIATPSGMFAGTDTKHYWDLTENLYRFQPITIAQYRNPHTVDESVSILGHESTVRFFYELIQNTVGWRQGDELA